MKNTVFRRLTALALALVMLVTLAACTAEDLPYISGIDALFGSDDSWSGISGGANPFAFDESNTDDMLTLDQLRAQLNEERKNDTRTIISDADRFLPHGYDTEEFRDSFEFSDAEVKMLTTNASSLKKLSFKQAQGDIDYLFRLFKTSYAPYEFFGGDEAFDRAKSEIVDDVYAHLQNDGISPYTMASIITKHLDFLHDSHLMIGISSPTFEEQIYYYVSNKMEFRKNDKGYYTMSKGEKLYLDKADEDYMHLTIGKSGELVYGLIKLCGQNSSDTLKKKFTLNGEFGTQTTINARWTSDPFTPALASLTWKDNVDGIPLTGIGSMAVDNDACIAEMNDFVNNAKTLSDADVAMLDLRGNMGGLSTISVMWLYNLTGEEIEGEQTMVYYNSVLNNFVSSGNDDTLIEALLKFDFFNEHPDMKEELLEETTDELYEGVIYESEDKWVEREPTLLVLSDKAVSSAGEMFLLQVKDVENSIIIGTNSNGCLVSGATNYTVPVYLPSSGLWVYYSTGLFLTDEPGDFDCVGIQPDVVVCGEDSAEAAARMWKFYN